MTVDRMLKPVWGGTVGKSNSPVTTACTHTQCTEAGGKGYNQDPREVQEEEGGEEG
jgi:hypothetical protein